MASTSQSNVSPQPLRLPKLSYRTKSSDNESINAVSTDVSTVTLPTNPTSPLFSTFCSSPREQAADTLSLTARSPSIASSSMVSKTPNSPSIKKAGFFTGLFAKEPSAQALADYQKYLLKQGRNRTSKIGLPGVSSAKLPPTVPRVNSKWDGVPQTTKERERQKQEHRKSVSGHSRNASAVGMAGSGMRSSTSDSQRRLSRGTLGGSSTHSNASSNRLADLYGWEGYSLSSSSSTIVNFAAEHRPATARMQTSHSAPPAPRRPPLLDRTLLFPPHSTHNTPTRSHSYFEQSCPSLSGSPYPPSHSHSPGLSPFESSPVTPDGPSAMKILPSPSLETKPQDDIKTTMVEVPASVDEVIIKSAGLNILGPPATAKRRPKATPCQSGSNRPNVSGSDMQLNSIIKKGTLKDTPSRPALSSNVPSPDSASPVVSKRPNSARERLGLGMSVKNQAIAPWYDPNQVGDAVEGERIVTPTPEGGQSSRRKGRMSLFKK